MRRLTGPAEIALAHEFGIKDRVPVTHENFRQWVIEDEFCAGRREWHRVGVIFSNRVCEYEAMHTTCSVGAGYSSGRLSSTDRPPVLQSGDCRHHSRVAFDGSSRHTGFVLPILRDGLEHGTSIEGLALVEAFWARMCEGTRENGSKIAPNDPNWQDLHNTAILARVRPLAWLEQSAIYGNLGKEPRFAGAFERWLTMIWSQGSAKALETYLAG